MTKLVKYDLKKHLRLVVIMSAILFSFYLLDSFRNPFGSGTYANRDLQAVVMDAVSSFLFMVSRVSLVGFMIYIGYDFIQNIMSDEKNFLFSIPVSTEKFFLSKIISTTILTGILYVSIAAATYLNSMIKSSLYVNTADSYMEHATLIDSFSIKALPLVYTYCLVALMILYFVILVFKKALEKTRFKFLWLLPFTLIFIMYYAFTLPSEVDMTMVTIVNGQFTLLAVNLVIACLLFLANSWILKTKTDI